jgi:signal transduction histidine kinase
VQEQVGRLASGLTHKLRNTLNAMRAHLALLQKFLPANAPEPAVRQVAKLSSAVDHMEEVLAEVLVYTNPAADQWEELDLLELTREVLAFLAPELEAGRVAVTVEAGHDLPAVLVDRAKMKRALLNLVLNARQAMADGGRLLIRASAADRGRVALEITDSGCGIPPEDFPRIFQPFFSTKPGRVGLGLAIAQRTVEDSGGELTFTSHVGAGTTFRLVLPNARRWQALLERLARRRQTLQPAP